MDFETRDVEDIRKRMHAIDAELRGRPGYDDCTRCRRPHFMSEDPVCIGCRLREGESTSSEHALRIRRLSDDNNITVPNSCPACGAAMTSDGLQTWCEDCERRYELEDENERRRGPNEDEL